MGEHATRNDAIDGTHITIFLKPNLEVYFAEIQADFHRYPNLPVRWICRSQNGSPVASQDYHIAF
jgi:hypothetical protein